ncbi:hypothetical protein ACOUWG_001925 [Listeria monocytogenes]|nr:hypothetical protein [Listeria monocytogenes]
MLSVCRSKYTKSDLCKNQEFLESQKKGYSDPTYDYKNGYPRPGEAWAFDANGNIDKEKSAEVAEKIGEWSTYSLMLVIPGPEELLIAGFLVKVGGKGGTKLVSKAVIKESSKSNPKVIEELTNPVLEAPRTGSGLKVDNIKPVKEKGSIYEIDPLTGKTPTKQTSIITDEFPHVPKAHGFSDIVDNYADLAKVTDLGNAKIYQVQGSQNGVMGRFEWIIQDGKVTHRMFVRNSELTGVPIK